MSAPDAMDKETETTKTVRKVIGYLLSDKKCQRLNMCMLESRLRSAGYLLERILTPEHILNAGPYEAIMLKPSDILVKINQGDEQSRSLYNAFQVYLKKYPYTALIDRFEDVSLLIDRNVQYKVILDSELAIEDQVFTPTFVELTSKDKAENLKTLKQNDVQFPFVCKSLVAHGCKLAHQMSIVFCEDGLDHIKTPCVAQTFINHNAMLYKLFVIGDKYHVIERPSLKNFKADERPNLDFFSHDISKNDSSSSLIKLDDGDLTNAVFHQPDKNRFDHIVEVLRKRLNLLLFGIDIIIDNVTGNYAVIDMNSFPGYDGVDTFNEELSDLLINKAIGSATNDSKPFDNINCNTNGADTFKKPNQINSNGTTHDFDSGIDTSDSCDEKSRKKENKGQRRQKQPQAQ